MQFKDGSDSMTLTSSFDVNKPPLRCSSNRKVDGNDQPCDARTFRKPMWIYWWPETGVKAVDFYLDGVFHRTERYAPWEFDGGARLTFRSGRTRSSLWFSSRTDVNP